METHKNKCNKNNSGRMTRKQFLEQHGNKRLKDVAGILHIYLPYDTIDKHYELENQIMIHDTMKVKDGLSKIEHLLEFDKQN
jgi:hypothetical protein